MMRLEPRMLLTAEGSELVREVFPLQEAIESQAALQAPARAVGDTIIGRTPLADVPVLNSLPGASARLFLDFNGDVTPRWGDESPGVTPAYDRDGDTSSFSNAELAAIREIWQRIAEKFSPFQLNVTTVDPGTLVEGKSARVVIGGNGDWAGGAAAGVGYVGGFSNSASNTAFAFSATLNRGEPAYVAETAAHEAGHLFGLRHQADYVGGRLVSDYNSGDDVVAPIMGRSSSAERGIWWRGPTDISFDDIQGDMAILGDTLGYRPDDHGDSTADADGLRGSGAVLRGSGIIESTSDADYFQFNTAAGTLRIDAARAAVGPMLDLKLLLRDQNGRIIDEADTNRLGESLALEVPAGRYYVGVLSHGLYGDVGQYTLTVNTAPAASAVTDLRATLTAKTRVHLEWTGNSADETRLRVEYSTNGRTWTSAGSVPANTTGATLGRLLTGTRYSFRVRAWDAAGNSSISNVAQVTTRGRAITPADNPDPTASPTVPKRRPVWIVPDAVFA